MEFVYPLWLITLIFPFILLYIFIKNRPVLGFSSKFLFPEMITTRSKFVNLPFYFFIISLFFVALSLSRPRLKTGEKVVHTEGIDIMLLLDMSGSMQIPDFSPNRFVVAKKVIEKFINGRKNDRIGLVAFAGEAYTQCPLTVDYSALSNILEQLKIGYIKDGTAIGMSIAEGVARFKHSKAPSKVMILLTDGENNAGSIDPMTAARVAKSEHIKIYSIGMGSNGKIGKMYGGGAGGLNEDLLRQIAYETGGKFYLATDSGALSRIYSEINKLEKGKIETKIYNSYIELFPFLAWIAFIFYLVAIILENSILLVVP